MSLHLAIQKVVEFLNKYKADRKNTCVVTLDLQSAFNNIWWYTVLYELAEEGCPRNLYQLVKSYVSDRKIRLQKESGWITRS